MSMEQSDIQSGDQEAAMNLLNDDPFLREDEYAQRVVRTGKAPDGRGVDLGNFLAARAAVLQEAVAKGKLKKINPEMVEVAYSVDLFQKSYNS